MRILLAGCYPRDARLGSSKLLLHLGIEFRRLGHEVDHMWLDDLPRWARQQRIAWLLFPVVLALNVFKAAKNGQAYDIIDVCGGDGWLISLTRGGLRQQPIMICRSQGWEHEYLEVLIQRLGGAKWRRALLMRLLRLPMVAIWARHSDAIIVGCSLRRSLPLERRWKPEERVFVVPYGVDGAYFASIAGNGRKGLLYAGSWLHGKGVHDLTEAYRQLHERGCDVPLTILGFGVSCEQVLRDFDPVVRGRIRVPESLRFVDEAKMMEEYQSHDLLAFPSHYEGFGLVFLEGMASGMAVIATPTGGVPDILRDRENGFIVPTGNANALAAAIEDLWASPELRHQLGQAAQETARQFTWGQIAAHTLDCYHTVAPEKSRGD